MNSHDETKKIIDLIRESNRKNYVNKNLIIEQSELAPTDQIVPGDDIADEFEETPNVADEIELDPVELKEEQKKFREQVNPRTEFKKFKLYPKAGNVEFSGIFQDSRIEWYYSLDDTRGVYITADMLQLRDDTLKSIQKLVGYYENWATEWANRIPEYLEEPTGGESEPEGGLGI